MTPLRATLHHRGSSVDTQEPLKYLKIRRHISGHHIKTLAKMLQHGRLHATLTRDDRLHAVMTLEITYSPGMGDHMQR